MIFSRQVIVLPLLFIASITSAAHAAAARAKPTRPVVDDKDAFKGAIVVDAASGHVLFERNADLVSPPASMTKLMTFAVLHDKLAANALSLTTPVTVNRAEAIFAMKSDSTSVWLKEKETFPVEELIYAMMIQSANDASLVLARAAAGSSEAFVELMNAKAHELGMTHTSFHTPHGLTKGKVNPAVTDLTTPRDFALLSRHLLLHTDVLKYTAVKTRSFGTGQRSKLVEMTNHNHLLGRAAGVDGLKTGYTAGAGFCLAATALRNGHRVIVVTMDGNTYQARDLKVIELLERGFSALPPGSPAFEASGATVATSAADTMPSPLTLAPLSSAEKPADASDSTIKFSIPKKK